MPPPAPDVPRVDLLWQYQVHHRENGHLLERINGLEAKLIAFEGRTQKAEETAATCFVATEMIKELEKRMKAYDDRAEEENRACLVNDQLGRHERSIQELQTTQARVSTLSGSHRLLEENAGELNKAIHFINERISELDVALSKLQENPLANSEPTASTNIERRLGALETRERVTAIQAREMQMEIARLKNLAQIGNEEKTKRHMKPSNEEIQVPGTPVVEGL